MKRNELQVYSKDFKLLESTKLKMMNACGTDYSPDLNAILVANASTDIISIYRMKDFKVTDEIKFSEKAGENSQGRASHK